MNRTKTLIENFCDIALENAADPLPALEAFADDCGFMSRYNLGGIDEPAHGFCLLENKKLVAVFTTQKNIKTKSWKFEFQDFENELHLLADHKFNIGSKHSIDKLEIEPLDHAYERYKRALREYYLE